MFQNSEIDNEPALAQAGEDVRKKPASGLVCLSAVASTYGKIVDPDELAKSLGFFGSVRDAEIRTAAVSLGFKAKQVRLAWDALGRVPLPLIARLRNGEFVLVARKTSERVLVVDPASPQQALSYASEEFERMWDGQAILIRSEFKGKGETSGFGFRWFVPIIAKFKSIILEIVLAAFAIQLFAIATPLFTQTIIDRVLSHHNVSTLHVFGTAMLVVIIFEMILSALQAHLMAHTSNRIDAVLGSKVGAHLLRLHLRYFESRRVGDTVARMRELESIRQFFTGASVSAILDVLFIAIYVSLLAYYSVTLTLVTVLTLPLLITLALVMRSMMRQRLEDRFNRGADNHSFLVEMVSGIHTIKSLTLEAVMWRKWEHFLARYSTATYRVAQVAGIGGALGQCIEKCSTLAVLWIGALLVMDGQLSVGQLLAFHMLSSRVIHPVVRIVQLWQSFQQVSVSVERLGDLMNAPTEPLGLTNTASPRIRGDVELESLSFRYEPTGPNIIEDISFRAAPGTTVGIIGRSGSGKSTLAV